ncbi:hypothetical protein T8K17_05620 [Thalassobaculum sp. OXR-137]|uniref:hypothetical protein n=1 Tax=Thalassobaculum sp. OXR-137 TaxID=3100173 RepID=UPI002AC8E4B0|nr:hypothetical protein [Thalassobaculum sp. OXR-137]WPZ35619.1 hypothetical protein T8K17_05620 [Thalassobaculum sp. OXR-137]
MVATIDSAAGVANAAGGSSQTAFLTASTRQQQTAPRSETTSEAPKSRPFLPNDPGYITVEPDGRDDVSFRDRLRQAIEAVASAFASGDGVTAIVDRVIGEISQTLDSAEAKGEQVAVQFRIAALDVSVADGGSAFASIRQFALEVGVARDGRVAAEDTRVLATDGRSLGLSQEQVRAGLTTGTFARTDTASSDGNLSEAARERLAAARSGLERVKAVQDALAAFRSGDETPLRDLFEGRGLGGSGDAGSLGQVFPGIGALSFR